MKKIYNLIIVISLVLFASCTKSNLIKTGFANGDHKMSMMEYFATDSYNWDSLRVMINHAGLNDIFEGTSAYGSNITFFGITNHSIRRYLYNNEIERVTDIPVEECKNYILSMILKERIMLDNFVPGNASSDPMSVIGKGGKIYNTLSGKQLWIYSFREAYNEVPNTGAVKIYLVSLDTEMSSKVASSNITTLTGVVHSLNYNFTLGDF